MSLPPSASPPAYLGGLRHGLGVSEQGSERLHEEDHVVQLLLPVPQTLLLVTVVQQVERTGRQQVRGQLRRQQVKQPRVLRGTELSLTAANTSK